MNILPDNLRRAKLNRRTHFSCDYRHSFKYSHAITPFKKQPPEMFNKKGVLKYFVRFTGKQRLLLLFNAVKPSYFQYLII